MTKYNEVRIRIWSDLKVGDTVLEWNDDDKGMLIKRPVVVTLPTEPFTVIRSTWNNSAGVADFEAILMPGQKILVNQPPYWFILDNLASSYSPEQLATLIDDFTVIAKPV